MSNHKKLSRFVHTFQVELSSYFLDKLEPRLSDHWRGTLRREAESIVDKIEDAGDRRDFSWIEKACLYSYICELLEALVEQNSPSCNMERRKR